MATVSNPETIKNIRNLNKKERQYLYESVVDFSGFFDNKKTNDIILKLNTSILKQGAKGVKLLSHGAKNKISGKISSQDLVNALFYSQIKEKKKLEDFQVISAPCNPLTYTTSVFDSLPRDILFYILTNMPSGNATEMAACIAFMKNAFKTASDSMECVYGSIQPKIFADWINVKKIPLKDLPYLRGIDCEVIFPHLTYLDISEMCFLHTDHLKECRNLQVLKIDDYKGNLEEILKKSPTIPELSFLSLRSCGRLSEKLFDILQSKFRDLKALDLSKCLLQGDEFRELKLFASLSHLSLAGCMHLDNTAILNLALLSELVSLDLSGCHRLTDVGLIALLPMKKLSSLKLSFCKGIVALNEKSRLLSLENLSILDLSACQQIGDEDIKHLLALKKITSLNLSGCSQLTGQSLAYLARSQSLTSLHLQACKGLRDEDFAVFANNKSLAFLEVTGCIHLTKCGLAFLKKDLTNLTIHQ